MKEKQSFNFCFLIVLLIFFLFISFSFTQVPGYDVETVTTTTIYGAFTNIGRLDWHTGIRWVEGDHWVEFQHGLWVTGLISDSLIGTTSGWAIDHSPGPIIDGQAAMLIHPEDSTKYRVYHIYSSSGEN